jgi:hypothetical protein
MTSEVIQQIPVTHFVELVAALEKWRAAATDRRREEALFQVLEVTEHIHRDAGVAGEWVEID